MAFDCWTDANRLAEMYSKKLDGDFWVLFAAKPHVKMPNGIVMGWEVIAKRPPRAMVGVMVFKWNSADQNLEVETDLSLPFDIPLSEQELSTNKADVVATVAEAGKKSNSILLA